jgi:hypothetical protein
MSIARRSFLKSATMTTLSAGLAIGSAHLIFGQQAGNGRSLRKTGASAGADFPISIEAESNPLFFFRSSTFSPYVGDIFQVPNARGETIEVTLTGVSDYKMNRATRISTGRLRQSESFSLTFTASERLPQFTSIHRMSHPALGEFDLFMTSHQTENGTFVYEAVFNHIQ